MDSKHLNFIDVFSGAGGLSCGLEMSGWRCLLGVDSDKNAIKTFARNHKYAETYCGDVTKLTKKQLIELTKNQEVHAVVGGPPCQGFSTVGTGNPEDERNSLFLQFVRLVRISKPSFIVVENVTGLLAKKNEDTLRAIFQKFSSLGYRLDVQVMASEEYGVPEMRRRTIIIGTKINEKAEFPLPTHSLQKQEGKKKAITVRKALASLKTRGGKIYNHDLDSAQVADKIDVKRLKRIPEGRGIRYQRDEKAFLPPSLRLGVDWDELPENRFRQTKYFRLDGNKPSPTIMTHRHSYYHPTEPRFLTQREAARLQSFPNNFVFEGPLSSQWRQIGNAVPPLLGKAIGHCLMEMYQKAQKQKRMKKQKKNRAFDAVEEIRGRAFSYRQAQ